MSCIFCEIKDYVLENDLAYAIFDKFPSLCFCPFHLSFYTSARKSFPLQQSPASQEFLEMCKMNNSQEGTSTCPSGNSFIYTLRKPPPQFFKSKSLRDDPSHADRSVPAIR